MRAVAILLVVVWHGACETGFPIAAMGLLWPVVMTGWAGVDLFFALSGFLITALLLREEQRAVSAGEPPHFSLGRFYARRALRILPPFYAVFLVLTFVLARWPLFSTVGARQVWAESSPLGLVPYATFWGNYFDAYGRAWFGRATYPGHAYDVFWSLCVEEHFYLLWPLVLVAVKGLRARLGVAVAVCLGLSVLRHLAIAGAWDEPKAVHYLSHYRMDSILWGGIGALLSFSHPPSAGMRRTLLGATALLLAALVLTRTMSVRPTGETLGFSLGFSLLAIVSTLFLLELAASPTGRLVRALEWRPLVVVGRASYAMYLLHFPMIDLGRTLFFAVPRPPTIANLLLSSAVFVVLTFAAGWALHRAVERPFLALKERFR